MANPSSFRLPDHILKHLAFAQVASGYKKTEIVTRALEKYLEENYPVASKETK